MAHSVARQRFAHPRRNRDNATVARPRARVAIGNHRREPRRCCPACPGLPTPPHPQASHADMSNTPKIIYTLTDEAPFLATYSLLPIVAGVHRHRGHRGRDARHLAGRPHPRALPGLPDATSRRSPTTWPNSASWRPRPEANIIKLPNISASVPQLKAAIAELQQQGYALPDYPEEPQDDAENDDQGALRQDQGQRGQPGAARRQFRPPRAAVGQELRAQASAQDGRVERGLEVARRAHGRR